MQDAWAEVFSDPRVRLPLASERQQQIAPDPCWDKSPYAESTDTPPQDARVPSPPIGDGRGTYSNVPPPPTLSPGDAQEAVKVLQQIIAEMDSLKDEPINPLQQPQPMPSPTSVTLGCNLCGATLAIFSDNVYFDATAVFQAHRCANPST